MSRTPEDEERFRDTVEKLHLLSALAPSSADLVFVQNELAKVDSFGHILDPTAYRRGMADREALAALVSKAAPFAAAAEKFAATSMELLARRAASGGGA
jgi:hypothetical protein